MASCSVESCTNPKRARGLCSKHYWRLRNHGTTELIDRFKDSARRTDTGCLLVGNNPNQYGSATMPDGTITGAHRVAYVRANGAIPDGMVIDHLCNTPACINPDHLAATSQRVNVLRSERTLAGRNARKTHCIHGHPLSGDNLYEHRGKRSCRTCRRESDRRRAAS